MKIFGTILSPYVARLVLAARRKGLKHDLVMPKDGTKTPAFLKMNPLGKMPVIKDGTTTLFESGVILEYIDAKYKKKRLIPADAKAAAKVRMIGAVFAEYVQENVSALFYHLDPAKRDKAVVKAKIAELDRVLAVAEKLAGKPFAAGSSFSLADCYAVPALFYAEAMVPLFGGPSPLKAHKKLSAYLTKARKDKLMSGVLREIEAEWIEWQKPKAKAA
jgi:glutathione S-transferase